MGVGALVEEKLDNAWMAAEEGDVEWRVAFIVDGIDWDVLF